MKFHDLVTCSEDCFVCGAFQFFPQYSAVLLSFFCVGILSIPPFIRFNYNVCVIRGFLVFLSAFSAKPLILSNTNFLIFFHRTSIFPFSHSTAQIVFTLEYIALSDVQQIKVKQTLYRTGLALKPQGSEAPRISRQSTHECGKVVSPKHRPPLPLLEADLTPEP